VPCYYWLLCLLKLIKPKSLNQCFINWVQSLVPETLEGFTLSFDGKTITTVEKNSGRIERRTAFSTCDIDWLYSKEEWTNLACIGAVNTQFTTKKETTNEWHYYISSHKLSAEQLLKHARLEWSVESIHWLLDAHFGEDFCHVENKNVLQNLNIIRKIVLNSIKQYKEKYDIKRPFSKIMLDCLLGPYFMLSLLAVGEN